MKKNLKYKRRNLNYKKKIQNSKKKIQNSKKKIQNCLDYTKMDDELQAHKAEILKEYERLPTLIESYFKQ